MYGRKVGGKLNEQHTLEGEEKQLEDLWMEEEEDQAELRVLDQN